MGSSGGQQSESEGSDDVEAGNPTIAGLPANHVWFADFGIERRGQEH
jgi:hypothetical protein